MLKILKQNGHPVSLKDIRFICKEKQYPKEACHGILLIYMVHFEVEFTW